MNKTQLIEAAAEKAGTTKKDTAAMVNAAMDVIKGALKKNDKVQLVGFGTFEVRQRKARKGRNPRNPEETIKIPASKAPVFKAGKSLKNAVNGK